MHGHAMCTCKLQGMIFLLLSSTFKLYFKRSINNKLYTSHTYMHVYTKVTLFVSSIPINYPHTYIKLIKIENRNLSVGGNSVVAITTLSQSSIHTNEH